MDVLAFFAAVVAVVSAWSANRNAMRSINAAARSGLASVCSRQAAKQAEAAAGIVAFPERDR